MSIQYGIIMRDIIHKVLRSIALRYLVTYSLSKSKYETDLVCYLYDRISWDVLVNGEYEGNLQNKAIKFLQDNNFSLGTLIDCGANIGTTSIQLSKYFQNIFSIESYEKTFTLLKLNTQNNTSIHPIHASLSNKVGFADLSYGDGFVCGASLINNPSSTHKIEVKTTTLDNLFQDMDFADLYIKLDIEGLEYQALLGAKNIIDKFRPVLFIEINKKQIANGSSDVFKLLAGLDYCFYNVQRQYLGNNIFLRNLKSNNQFEVVKTNKLIKKHFLYKFMICIPKESVSVP